MTVYHDLSLATWRTSSYSGGNSGGGSQCVEIGYLPSVRAVRDTKHRVGPALVFANGEWITFVRDLTPRSAAER